MFDWMQSPPQSRRPERTLAGLQTEIRARARLLAALGFDRARIQTRITSELWWEYELVGKPRALTELPALVAEACGHTGAPAAETEAAPAARKKPVRRR